MFVINIYIIIKMLKLFNYFLYKIIILWNYIYKNRIICQMNNECVTKKKQKKIIDVAATTCLNVHNLTASSHSECFI